MKQGEVYKLDNLFSKREVSALKKLVNNLHPDDVKVKDDYGRRIFQEIHIPRSVIRKLTKLVNGLSSTTIELEILNPANGAEYGLAYDGNPNLPPHFDGDFNEVIIDYQLDSSPDTVWPIGVDLTLYPLHNNEAVMFNPNASVHWRPIRAFKDSEYITMLFFRFYAKDPAQLSDYSYLPGHPQDKAFEAVNQLRDSLPLE